ncbi:GTP cyclohydrolase FolE2 [Marinicella sp. S1101]|uniref:GTP cyclohydrolase FolE2 n=1 Tax=Marinicella marina TaxID=2996016 RepID=UPI002260FFF4|nr:GTP cyclohydrolase FolE2 [Marinicella marina]MCX7552323.1 GTP cyclohydrolase FolE2 [Marinicella marina]MDJ1139198.1 GTP cyclohydrolase FolE2 [Marinicella marina]
MLDSTNQTPTLPDIAAEEKAKVGGQLQWVGMSDIEMPLVLSADAAIPNSVARVRAEVSLDDEVSKGIHMSRLYLACDEVFSQQKIDYAVLTELTHQFLRTHHELSSNALIEVESEALLRRPALVSEYAGWRSYPIKLTVVQCHKSGISQYLSFQVTYSSTCPCSAALARQLIQENFKQNFDAENFDYQAVVDWLGSETGINATPHSQRSSAVIKVKLDEAQQQVPLQKLIDLVENALQTAVQAAVKRADEQAFALRNGQNLMFCEDAARRIKQALMKDELVKQFHLRVTHHESLHPHDATAEAYSE